MGNEPLRLGLVGCGSIAQAHAAALRFLTDDGLVRVTAAADPDPDGVERVAKILGGIEHTGADGYAVIDHDEVDAVVNITPTRFHHDYMAAIARAGKPCFAESRWRPRSTSCSTSCGSCTTRASRCRSGSSRGSIP